MEDSTPIIARQGLSEEKLHRESDNKYQKHVLLSLLAVISCVFSQEVAIPERFLRPRNFNPHPYTVDNNPRDYSIEYSVESEPPRHPSLDQHPYPLFQRVDLRNNDNSPVRFPVVPQELKKSIKNKASSKYLHEPKNYAFSYAVKDHQSGDDFSHSQAHNGKATQGEYRVKLPDGRVQVVSYTADNDGYKAEVRYDGERVPEHEENTYRNQPPGRLTPHPYPVPGYISALYNKKPLKTGPTTQTLLVYTPDSGYRAASVPVPIKYKSAVHAVPKISPTISTDGGLGYHQRPVYYASNSYSEQPTPTPTPSPDIKSYISEDALQSIAAKYLQDVLPGQDHRPTEPSPSLRNYAAAHKFPSSPGSIFQDIVSGSPAKVVDDEGDTGSVVNYSSEIQTTAFPPQNIYGSSTPSSLIYSDGYFALPTNETPQNLVKYIYVSPSDFDRAPHNQH